MRHLVPLLVILCTASTALAGESVLAVSKSRDPDSATMPRQNKTWREPVTGMEFVWIPGGCFEMGQSQAERSFLLSFAGEEACQELFFDEAPRGLQCLDGFWLGRYEVTADEFAVFTEKSGYRTDAEREGTAWAYDGQTERWTVETGHARSWKNPGFPQGGRHPVTTVSWNDAQAMARWLSDSGVGVFRLPTEREWEYACRGGTVTIWFWGDDPDKMCTYCNIVNAASPKADALWKKAPSCLEQSVYAAMVGSYAPNPFGLFDILGNVWEWCDDLYLPDHETEMSGQDDRGAGGTPKRVLRGGGWNSYPSIVRPSFRCGYPQAIRSSSIGFRLAMSPEK